MLGALTRMCAMWSYRQVLTASMLSAYEKDVELFAAAWSACGWKATVWVHWVVCHLLYDFTHHRNHFAFSSIPSEYKHYLFDQVFV